MPNVSVLRFNSALITVILRKPELSEALPGDSDFFLILRVLGLIYSYHFLAASGSQSYKMSSDSASNHSDLMLSLPASLPLYVKSISICLSKSGIVTF